MKITIGRSHSRAVTPSVNIIWMCCFAVGVAGVSAQSALAAARAWRPRKSSDAPRTWSTISPASRAPCAPGSSTPATSSTSWRTANSSANRTTSRPRPRVRATHVIARFLYYIFFILLKAKSSCTNNVKKYVYTFCFGVLSSCLYVVSRIIGLMDSCVLGLQNSRTAGASMATSRTRDRERRSRRNSWKRWRWRTTTVRSRRGTCGSSSPRTRAWTCALFKCGFKIGDYCVYTKEKLNTFYFYLAYNIYTFHNKFIY